MERINQRITDAKDSQEYVVCVRNIKMLRSGKKTADLSERIVVMSDSVFSKEQANVFAGEEILKFLEKNNINAVGIIGIDGNSRVAVNERSLAITLCYGLNV